MPGAARNLCSCTRQPRDTGETTSGAVAEGSFDSGLVLPNLLGPCSAQSGGARREISQPPPSSKSVPREMCLFLMSPTSPEVILLVCLSSLFLLLPLSLHVSVLKSLFKFVATNRCYVHVGGISKPRRTLEKALHSDSRPEPHPRLARTPLPGQRGSSFLPDSASGTTFITLSDTAGYESTLIKQLCFGVGAFITVPGTRAHHPLCAAPCHLAEGSL